jgi:hypothetical protein
MEELEALMNRYSIENESNTPDFLLAEYVRNCLNAYNEAVRARDAWYDVNLEPGNAHFGEDHAIVYGTR